MDILRTEREETKVDEEEIETLKVLKLFKEFGLKRIMVVDDEEFCQTMMLSILST